MQRLGAIIKKAYNGACDTHECRSMKRLL